MAANWFHDQRNTNLRPLQTYDTAHARASWVTKNLSLTYPLKTAGGCDSLQLLQRELACLGTIWRFFVVLVELVTKGVTNFIELHA